MPLLARLHDASSRLLFAAACLALALAACLYVLEVVLRYLFDAPTTWTNEAVQYCLALMIFLGLPELTRQSAHIAIDILPTALPAAAGAWLNRFGLLVAVAACLTAGWIVAGEAVKQLERGLMTNAAHPIPRWWITAVIALGLASSALYFIRQLFGQGR